MRLQQCSKIDAPRGVARRPATHARWRAPPESAWASLESAIFRAWYGDAVLVAAHVVACVGQRVPGAECFADDVGFCEHGEPLDRPLALQNLV